MNGIPVCLGRKTENAPTWRPRSPVFGTRFLAIFQAFLDSRFTPLLYFTPIPTHRTTVLNFVLIYSPQYY